MRNGPILIADRSAQINHEPTPSCIVIEHDRVDASRRHFPRRKFGLRTLQYLFVTKTSREEVRSFAGDLSRADNRDVAFLVFDDAGNGTILRARVTQDGITLKSVGSCGPLATDVPRIPTFAADSRRFCPRGGCSVKYGMVVGHTVRFWRKEDTLGLKRNETQKAVGALLVEHFGDYYNISIDSSAGISMPWPDALAKLINHDIDVMLGLKPEVLRVLDNLEIICWYMYRDMAFAGLVRVKNIQNHLLRMFMPFQYLVWMCVILLLVVYVLLLIVLRKLSDMGLIKERVKFMYVCTIMLSQGITYPSTFGLRLVLLFWIVFSLFMNIACNSTITSSLAEVESDGLLNSLKQLRDSGQPVDGLAIFRSYFNDSSEEFVRDLNER
ncbi:uncharacterized protein LOC143179415 [Calliopsis andreniformis]|uniref:uncharacterized protein LOC143179415 n=1 Tax=Calliopsis andreniformis TaxID=337506 RepID=UPI003FCE8103